MVIGESLFITHPREAPCPDLRSLTKPPCWTSAPNLAVSTVAKDHSICRAVIYDKNITTTSNSLLNNSQCHLSPLQKCYLATLHTTVTKMCVKNKETKWSTYQTSCGTDTIKPSGQLENLKYTSGGQKWATAWPQVGKSVSREELKDTQGLRSNISKLRRVGLFCMLENRQWRERGISFKLWQCHETLLNACIR